MNIRNLIFYQITYTLFIFGSASPAASLDAQGVIPSQDGYIYFISNLNGSENKRLLFSTGYSIPRYAPQNSQATQATGRDAFIIDEFGKKKSVRLAHSLNWKIGDYLIQDTEVVEDDFGMTQRFTGIAYDGAIGLNSLQHAIIKLDFDKLAVSIVNAGRASQTTFKDKLRINWLNNKPTVNCELADEKIDFVINTGNNGVIFLPPANFGKLVENGNIALEVESNSGGATIQQIRRVHRGWFQRGTMMGKELKGIAVAEHPAGRAELCLNWLRLFNCEFDMERSQFSYELRNKPSPPINWQTAIGAIFEFSKGQVKIWAVAPESASDKAGIKKGDEVLNLGTAIAADLNVELVSSIIANSLDSDINCTIKSLDGNIKTVVVRLGKAETFWTH